jgi:hypothetical protein
VILLPAFRSDSIWALRECEPSKFGESVNETVHEIDLCDHTGSDDGGGLSGLRRRWPTA